MGFILFTLLFISLRGEPSIADTICPAKWLTVGPFSVGPREGIAGVLDSIKGFIPSEGAELPSILAQGGKVSWQSTLIDSNGVVPIDYENVWWDTLQDIYGIPGVLSLSYAFTTFQVEGEKRALAITKGIGSFVLNDKSYPGNPYEYKYMKTPVVLKDGENRVFLASRGNFSFKLVPVPAPVMVIKDVTLPDIVEREFFTYAHGSGWAGITLLNTTEERLTAVVSIGGKYFKNLSKAVKLEPLCVKKMRVPIRFKKLRLDKEIEELLELQKAWLPISIRLSGEEVGTDSVKLRVRKQGEPYKITFISGIDSSVQYFAVLPPKDFSIDKEYGLILSLHGAGVEAQGLVNAFTPKDWAYIITPTNRRPYGFDWQDWGRLDALEVLREAKARFKIDENRIYLIGHSMGGHGVWAISTLHPDLFAAIAPAAGWTSHQLYVPWTLQKSQIFAHPNQLAYRNIVLREDQPLSFLENLKNVPVFILQGGSDDNVPPVHARMFTKYLKGLNYEVEYLEVPGKRHWWKGCVDLQERMDFLKNHTRNPYPDTIIFKLTNPGLNNQCYWVKVDEQLLLYQDSKISAIRKGDTVEVFTQNVKAFTLFPVAQKEEITFIIDGKAIKARYKKPISFYKKRGKFIIAKSKHKKLYKRPDFYGPLKQAYFTPFVLIYGTQGDSIANQISYNNAWGEAWKWWQNANGFVEMFADTEVSEEVIQNYNLILFGGPGVNLITKRINPYLPIRIKNTGTLWVGDLKLEQKGLAFQEIYPNPLNPNKLVALYGGVDIKGERIAHFFSTLYSGAGVPDFVIYDKEVKKKGWAGVKSAGFFNQEWKLDKSLMYFGL